MNEKLDLFTEKYTSILCGIVAFIKSVFDFNNTSITASVMSRTNSSI